MGSRWGNGGTLVHYRTKALNGPAFRCAPNRGMVDRRRLKNTFDMQERFVRRAVGGCCRDAA